MIKPLYESISSINENTFLVRNNNKYRLINKNQISLNNSKYCKFYQNSEDSNKHIALENGQYKLINSNGDIIEVLRFNNILKGDCNSYGGRINSHRNYLKTIFNGEEINSKEYTYLDDFTRFRGLWGVINNNGEELILSLIHI